MRETAYAKINLALHVRKRRADGYHDIETVFAFAEDGDVLDVVEGEGLTLQLTGPFAGELPDREDNLVLRAARALRERFGVASGATLTLDKRLPVAAGLGGGSADAAAAMRLLARYWPLDASEEEMLGIAASLGADVPACLASRPARGEARGDVLTPIGNDVPAGAPLLLVNPRMPLTTAAVFRAWDGRDRGPLGDWRAGRNDLEPAASGLAPELAQTLDSLRGARFARMSGSGATCFGLYDSEADRDLAHTVIRRDHPGYWTMATSLRP